MRDGRFFHNLLKLTSKIDLWVKVHRISYEENESFGKFLVIALLNRTSSAGKYAART